MRRAGGAVEREFVLFTSTGAVALALALFRIALAFARNLVAIDVDAGRRLQTRHHVQVAVAHAILSDLLLRKRWTATAEE